MLKPVSIILLTVAVVCALGAQRIQITQPAGNVTVGGGGGGDAYFVNSTLTWAATNTINLATNAHRTLVLGGDTTFETGTVVEGTKVLVICYNDQSTNCALVFPGAWQFFNVSMPTTLAAGKRGLLSLSTFGTASTNVMATYGATP